MTHPDAPSGQPYSGPLPPPWPAPEQRKRSWFARHKPLTVILALIAAVVVLGGIGAALGGNSTAPNGSASKTVTAPSMPPLSSEQKEANASASNAPETTPVGEYTPTVKDFKVSIRTTSKQCFGDAGCLVEYKVSLAYSGAQPLDPGKSYDVTYHVTGPEDGGQDETIMVTGDSYDQPLEQSAQTPRSSTRLLAKVTSVEES